MSFPAAMGYQGRKGDAALFAPGERLLISPVGERVAILHTDDGDDLLCLLDLVGRDLA